jgi:hypothetical protein
VPQRSQHVDLDVEPSALRRFLQRHRRLFAIIAACGVLLLFGVFTIGKLWLGRCGGTEADHAFAADLRDDPLMAALPPGATSVQDSTVYACPRRISRSTVGATPRAYIEITKQSRLTDPMSTVELHEYLAMTVGRSDWQLIGADEQSLSYCRVFGSYRAVSVMSLDDVWLTNHILVWTDGRGCAPEIASPS